MASEDRHSVDTHDVAPCVAAEHPQDVLRLWLDWAEQAPVALAVVTATEGGGVRAPGALMAVRMDGARAGYVSGGCIDADVALQAVAALEEGAPRRLRYGAGSPFVDVRLPCGGAIEVAILPRADRDALRACHARLEDRAQARLSFADIGFEAFYAPKLRLRIAGRGPDASALAQLARAAGLPVIVQSPSDADGESGGERAVALRAPDEPTAAVDDPWTAFVSMLHDPEWEDGLLRQALQGPAFYVGAVGSRSTHTRRCERLRASGVADEDLRRMRGPIGLVPSMRDASMVAVSALSEIVAEFHRRALAPFRRTAVILLAAGSSSRFAGGDKLLAPFRDGCVLDGAASLLAFDDLGARIAVAAPEAPERQARLRAAGWEVVSNPRAEAGLGGSLACGVRAAMTREDIDAAIVLLADMPAVPEAHLRRLQEAREEGRVAAMTRVDGVLTPPAIFRRDAFEALCRLDGDVGARSVFAGLADTAMIELDRAAAYDIDTVADLAAAR